MLRKKGARLYLEFTEALGSMICMQWVLQTLQYIRLQRLWRFLQRLQEAMKPNICDKVRFRSITLGKTLNCMLKESRKNRHPCLVYDFRSKAISFFLVNIVVVVVTLFFGMLWSLCYFEICYFLFIISSVLLSEGWWTLPKPFSVFMEKILWFLSLSLLKCCLELWIIDLCMLTYHCISVLIMTALILNVFLISDWKNFTEIFTSMFIRKIGLYCALILIRSSQPGVSLSHVGTRLVMIL